MSQPFSLIHMSYLCSKIHEHSPLIHRYLYLFMNNTRVSTFIRVAGFSYFYALISATREMRINIMWCVGTGTRRLSTSPACRQYGTNYIAQVRTSLRTYYVIIILQHLVETFNRRPPYCDSLIYVIYVPGKLQKGTKVNYVPIRTYVYVDVYLHYYVTCIIQ